LSKHLDIGKKGEAIAQEYLINLGYSILEVNWRSKHLETDIIAKKEDVIHFIEVKTRDNPLVDPLVSVTLKKQKNLLQAANTYIQEREIDKEIQFDIITVSINNNNVNINHVKDAFYPF